MQFDYAKTLDNELIYPMESQLMSEREIKEFKELITRSSWYKKLKNTMKELVNILFEKLQEMGDLTIMTHMRISKSDIDNLSTEKRYIFAKTLLMEGLRVIQNWNCQLPDSVLLFNGRLSPYSVVWTLAKEMNIKVVFHERGDYFGYMFCENSVPSAGEYVHEFMEKIQA